MANLLRNRWLRWALLAGALIALGVGIYRLEEPAPRWMIDTDEPTTQFLADPGNRLVSVHATTHPVTVRRTRKSGGKKREFAETTWRSRQRLHVTDIRTGIHRATFLDDETIVLACAQSSDGRFYAAETCSLAVADAGQRGNHLLLRIDLVGEKIIEIPLGDTPVNTTLTFSRDGKLLARLSEKHHQVTEGEPKRLEVFDTATGTRLHDLPSQGLQASQHFADDILLHDAPSPDGAASLEAFNPRTGARLFRDVSASVWITPDGSYLLCANSVDEKGIPWAIWNLRTFAREGQIPMRGFSYLSDDGRHLVDRVPDGQDWLCELPSGRRVGALPPLGKIFTLQLSPDSKYIAVVNAESPALALVEAPAMEVLWTRHSKDAFHPLHFSPDSKTLFAVQVDPCELFAFDCATGEPRYRLPLPQPRLGYDVPIHHMTPDQTALLIQQSHGNWSADKLPWRSRIRAWLPWLSRLPESKNDTLVVLDTATCLERFRLFGWSTRSALLADDGRTLVTAHGDVDGRRILRCWDVDAWKPLHWPIGVPAGLGALVVLFAWWRGRRRTPGQARQPLIPPA